MRCHFKSSFFFAVMMLGTGAAVRAQEKLAPGRLPEPNAPAEIVEDLPPTPKAKSAAPPEFAPIPASVQRPAFAPLPPPSPKDNDTVPIAATFTAPAPVPVPDDPKPNPNKIVYPIVYPPDEGILLEVEEAVEIAIQRNLGLQLSRLTDRASDYSVRIAWSQFFPTFNESILHSNAQAVGRRGPSADGTTTVTSGVTQKSPWGTTMNLQFVESRAGGLNSNSRSVDANFTQPLWKGFGTDANLLQVRQARLQRLITRGTLELDTQNLIFAVRRDYANIIRVIQTREVDREALDSALQFLDFIQNRVKAGIATQNLDYSQAKAQVESRRLNLVSDERQLGDAYDRLKQDMDIDLTERLRVQVQKFDFGDVPTGQMTKDDRVFDVLESDYDNGTVYLQRIRELDQLDEYGIRKYEKLGEPKVVFQAQRFDENKALAEALSNRIDLLNGRRALAQQQLNTLAAKNAKGYQVDLVGSYGHAHDGAGVRALNQSSDFNNWTVGVNASVPWGKIADNALYEQARLQLQSTEIELNNVRYNVQLSVRAIMRTLREAERTILTNAQLVESSKRTVRATYFAFQNGFRNSFEVTQVKDQLLVAKNAYINATLSYVVDLAQLETVIGKPTGRVDLQGETLGGEILSHLPDSLSTKQMPRPAPDAEPSCEDHALNNSRAYRCDPKPEPDVRLRLIEPRKPGCECDIIDHRP
jgi:outer membrane protein TolC